MGQPRPSKWPFKSQAVQDLEIHHPPVFNVFSVAKSQNFSPQKYRLKPYKPDSKTNSLLGGWTNPSEKYAKVKMGSSCPRFGVKIPKIFELPPPDLHCWLYNPYMGVSLNGGTPIPHPKCWSFLVGKQTHGFVGVSPTILGVAPIFNMGSFSSLRKTNSLWREPLWIPISHPRLHFPSTRIGSRNDGTMEVQGVKRKRVTFCGGIRGYGTPGKVAQVGRDFLKKRGKKGCITYVFFFFSPTLSGYFTHDFGSKPPKHTQDAGSWQMRAFTMGSLSLRKL